MGLTHSRRTSGVEEAEISPGNPYRYPPKSGNYFGSYFIMGGERFETPQQDAYLFGENEDLNFLGNKPVPFPYSAPQAHEPTKTLKSLVNIRRDSLRFVRESEDSVRAKGDGDIVEQTEAHYSIEFTFDSDVKCAITIYYFATEEISNGHAVYHPRDPRMNSETFHYKRGANQIFSQSTHVIVPTKFSEEDWQYSIDREVIPVVIQCVVEEEECIGHSHMTFAVVDKLSDGGFNLRCLKQKQMVDGVGYLLQEIYGIENKNTERAKQDDDVDDNGSECVICMCETRDTLILPCRHLCLCNGCADNLRYQANNCPICRAKFYALLQIRAMRRKVAVNGGTGGGSALVSSTATARPTDSCSDLQLSQEGVPPGYEAVSLIEALNGPTLPHCALNAPVLSAEGTLHSLCSEGAAAVPAEDDASPKDLTTELPSKSSGSRQSSVEETGGGGSDDRGECASNSSQTGRLPEPEQQCCRPRKHSHTKIKINDDDNLSENESTTSNSQSEAVISRSLPHVCPASVHSSVEIVSELTASSQDSVRNPYDCADDDELPGAVTSSRIGEQGGTARCATPPTSAVDEASSRLLLDVCKSSGRTCSDGSSDTSVSSNKDLLNRNSEMTDSEAV